MSRRLARAGRLGQRVSGRAWSPAASNRITTAPEDVKELNEVHALAPGIWYLDGTPIVEEPTQEIMVPFDAAGKELTVGDSYGIEVQAADGLYMRIDAETQVFNTNTEDLAEVGDTVRNWKSQVGDIVFDRSTANQQPILGAYQAFGNFLSHSDDLSQPVWRGTGIYDQDFPTTVGPNGETAIVVEYVLNDTSSNSLVIQDIPELGDYPNGTLVHYYFWAKIDTDESQLPFTIRANAGSSIDHHNFDESGVWKLFTGTASLSGIENQRNFRIVQHSDPVELPATITIGRCWVVVGGMSKEYVKTHDTPSIPNWNDYKKAVVFDGVNDSMSAPNVNLTPEYTIFQVASQNTIQVSLGCTATHGPWGNADGGYRTDISSASPTRAVLRYFQTPSTGGIANHSVDVGVGNILVFSCDSHVHYLQLREDIQSDVRTSEHKEVVSNTTLGNQANVYLDGSLSVMIQFNKLLTSEQIDKVLEYLDSEYRSKIHQAVVNIGDTITTDVPSFWYRNDIKISDELSDTLYVNPSVWTEGDSLRVNNSKYYIVS